MSKYAESNASKMHLAVDAQDNPIKLLVSNGTPHDTKIVPKQTDFSNMSDTVYADKGYDSSKPYDKNQQRD